MAVEILYPDGTGTYSDWAASAGNAWDCVNDPSGSPDDDTSYIYKTIDAAYTSSYSLTAPSVIVDGNTINSITVYFRARLTGGTGNLKPGLVRSSLGVGTSTAISTSYTTYSEVIARPGGGSWTFSDLANLEVAIQSVAPKKVGTTDWRVTQLYASVDYSAGNEPPTTPTLSLPQDNSTVWKLQPQLTTSSVTGTGTITFQVQVDTESGFNAPVTTEISGLASSVTTGTGWRVPIELVPNTQYYWRARANNGLDSNWSTVSGFTVGLFPAPTGLQCEKSSTTPIQANGYPCFSAVFLDVASVEGPALGAQIAMIASGNDFNNPDVLSSWYTIASTASGVRSPIIIYSGSLSSYYNNAFSGLNWAIRFRNTWGVYSSWGSGNAFYMNRKHWELPEKGERKKLDFGTTHLAIPSGYTANLEMNTGTAKLIAENLPVESLVDAFFNVTYANGKTHVVYLGDYEAAYSGFTIYVATKDHVTDTWGDPYCLGSAYTTNDTHHQPSLVVDNQGYIHVFYGSHSTYTSENMKYRRSVQPNKTGSGDDGTWTTVSSIAHPTTYNIPLVTRDNDIYVLFRTSLAGSGAAAGIEDALGYIKSTDGGDSWSAINFIASGYNNGRVYMHGYCWERDINRYHAAISFLDSTPWSLGVWYAYTDDFVTWKTVSGTTCGTTSTLNNAATMMCPTGTAYIPSVIKFDDSKTTQYFCRPIVIDKNNYPHVFYNAERSTCRFYHQYYLQEDQSHYFPIPILHAAWNGSSWVHTDITSQIDVSAWAPNYSVKPLIDKDDNIALYLNEKPLKDYSIQPTISGTYSDFTPSTGATYNCVNYGNYLFDSSKHISKGTGAGKVTFSGTMSTIPTGYVSYATVESICKKTTEANLRFCHTLLISGVLYSGSSFSWEEIWGGSAWENYPERPYIYTWYKNPHTNSGWVRSDFDTIQFGVSKDGTGTLTVHDLIFRVGVINNNHPNQFAGEVLKLKSADNGLNWSKEYITNYSSRGVPQLSIKSEFSNNQLEMVWSAGNKLYYYNQDKLNHFRNDGSDFRIYYGTQEIDRIADRWNNDSTSVSFKIQEAIPSGYPYANKDYYIYNLDSDSTYAKDDPKNVYKFYESFSDYPALQLFPGIRIARGNITKNDAVYESADENAYNATYDLKNDSSLLCSGIHINLLLNVISTPAISPESAECRVRVSNSSTYDSSKVIYTGSIAFGSIISSGTYRKEAFIHNLNTTSGTSVKIDFNYILEPSNSSSFGNLWIDDLTYVTAVSGWGITSGIAFITDSAPKGPAFPFAGSKALRLGGQQAGTLGGTTRLVKTIGTGINNAIVEFAINPMRTVGAPGKRNILLSGNSQAFGLGVNLNIVDDGEYTTGPSYYTSGTTDFNSLYSGIGDQSWHQFKILVRNGLCDAWADGTQICTGINALSNGFNSIVISGQVFDVFDYIRVYDYLENTPILSGLSTEYKCINFTAAIQGKQSLLIGFNYVIDQHYLDYKAKAPYEWFYTVFMDKKIIQDNLYSPDLKYKISPEYMTFLESYNKASLDWMSLFDGSKSKFSIESVNTLDAFAKVNIEYNESVHIDSKIVCDYLYSNESNIKIDIDYTSLVHSLCKILSDNSASIEAHAKIFAENTGFVVAAAKLANGYFASVAIDNKLNIEDLGILESNFKICSDYIKSIEADNKYNIDNQLLIEIYSKIIAGYLMLLEADSNIIPSWLQEIASDFKIDMDNLSCILSVDNKYNLEPGLSTIRLIKLPEDYLTTFDILHKVPFEWLGEVVVSSDLKIPVSYLGQIDYKSNFPLENLQSTDARRNAWFDYTGSLSVDNKVNIDNLRSILVDKKYPIDNLTSIYSDLKILCEACLSSISEFKIPSDNLETVYSDQNFEVDYLGTAVITIDNKIPLDFTVNLDSFLKVNIETAISTDSYFKLDRDNLSNVDLLTKIPLDVLSNITTDIKINDDSISNVEYDSKISNEFLSSLSTDFIIPLEYTAEGIFTTAGFKIPLFWLSSLENDNKANIEFTSELVAVGSSSKVLIDYGSSVDYYTKFDTEFQLAVQSMAKIIESWCSTVDAKAKISVSNISKVDRFVKLDIEFGRNVYAQAKIPIEALRMAVRDTNIPITSIGGALVPLFFRNIRFLVPEISNFLMELPQLRDILIKAVEPIIDQTSYNLDDISVKSPEAENITFSGQSVS